VRVSRMTAKHRLMLATPLLLLAACGQRANLAYPAGAPGPAIPTGDSEAPTPTELVTPTTQARPARNDELLRQSEERKSDEFDLPPE
jgi:hypothetical protein